MKAVGFALGEVLVVCLVRAARGLAKGFPDNLVANPLDLILPGSRTPCRLDTHTDCPMVRPKASDFSKQEDHVS